MSLRIRRCLGGDGVPLNVTISDLQTSEHCETKILSMDWMSQVLCREVKMGL
jgi:hypothetical protein